MQHHSTSIAKTHHEEITGPDLLYHPREAGTNPMPLLIARQQEGIRRKVNNVLITGVGGNIGLILADLLPREYNIWGIDAMWSPGFDPNRRDPNQVVNLLHQDELSPELLIRALEDRRPPEEVLRKKLRPHLDLARLKNDLDPRFDMTDYDTVLEMVSGMDVVVHLAWDVRNDNWCSGKSIDLKNTIMAVNVLRAAIQAGVRRVILASSVHADDFMTRKTPPKVPYNPRTKPHPICGYGQHKVLLEALGKHCSERGLEVACARFGGTCYRMDPRGAGRDSPHKNVYLHPEDCAAVTDYVIGVESLPKRSANPFYAVSESLSHKPGLSGWKPSRRPDDYNPRVPPFRGTKRKFRERQESFLQKN